MSTPTRPSEQQIRELAYSLWEADGRPDGAQENYWLKAERQLESGAPATLASKPQAVDDSIRQSFPASDPAATRSVDKPPVNADAKWQASAKAKTKASPRSSGRPSEPKRPPH